MQIVINRGFGGYGLSEFAAAELGCDLSVSKGEEFRTSAALVDLLEVHGSTAVSGFCATLEVVEIPDCASDWDVYDNDGAEWVVYVVDGKLCDSRFPSRRRTTVRP